MIRCRIFIRVMFNIILDTPPDSFGGCPILTDFRQGLKFYRIVAGKDLDEREKALLIFKAFFGDNIPKSLDGIDDFLKNYISGGDVRNHASTGKKTFDFNVDAGRLFAAFWQTYRIDLRTADLHWWAFLELFRALPEDTHLMKVIEIRGKKMPKDAESAKALRAAQRAYAIIDETAKADFKSFLRG